MNSSDMEMAFRIRSSKFRHVYGEAFRKDRCYENIRLTRNAHDSNFCAVNPKFLAVVTESSGGGAFIVLPVEKVGRIDINSPRVCGHARGVLDIKWNPFRDDIIASGSDDCTVKLWQIPETGLRKNLTEWQVDLHGHERRVGYIEWHPTAENIILSAGLDYKCIAWNVERAEPVNVIDCHPNVIHSISWNRDGSLFCTTCKDKTLRVIDPRAGTAVVEASSVFHGCRPSKSIFLGDTGKIFCSGVSGSGERALAIWDIRNMQNELTRMSIDNSNGILLPFYDYDTHMVYLAGKGDGNIRYYEMVNDKPYCHFLSNYGSSAPQRGLGMMPKRGCDPSRCEVMRFYKLHAARDYVEPVSMIVPRKSNIFHDDIFPPTASAIPSLSADEWINGQNREPILISMKDGVLNQAPTITTYKAVTSQTAPSTSPAAPLNLKQEPKIIPASLKNIKQLSTNEDIIVLAPSKKTEVTPVEGSSKVTEEENSDKEKAFVNSKIAAFESRGNANNCSQNTEVVSPARRRFEQRSWSANQENPPDLIANGMKGNSVESRKSLSDDVLVNVHNAAQYFEHKEIEIIDICKEEKKEKCLTEKPSKPTNFGPQSPASRLILGDITDDQTQNNSHKIHVKKTWSPMKSPSNALWEENTMPSTDPELRKAYFRQVEEIKSLKEQIGLKDKRIRQLEDEVNVLRKGNVTEMKQGESDC